MDEWVVISGKGGTGKTSIVASLAMLAKDVVIADCDVDAADLHLILAPQTLAEEDFVGGSEARIDQQRCIGCGQCADHCRFHAIHTNGRVTSEGKPLHEVDAIMCEGCGLCARVCKQGAVLFEPVVGGKLYIADSRGGPMVHARLGVGGENSGKLVSLVRERAREVAKKHSAPRIIIDGPPGIGCPVIASLSGVSLVLIVTEPTRSGAHDLKRVLELADHFKLPAAICVNKWDINPSITEQIESLAKASGAVVLPRVRYDRGVTCAQIEAKAVVEQGGEAAEDIRALWEGLESMGGVRA